MGLIEYSIIPMINWMDLAHNDVFLMHPISSM